MLHFNAPEDSQAPQDYRIIQTAGELDLNTDDPSPDRERLRHLIIGSPEGVRSAVNRLHTLQYAEQLAWSQLLRIPPAGITLTPVQGEAFSYLLRYRQLD